MKSIKHYLGLFKELEINKTTKDVEIDFIHLNYKLKFKFFMFCAFTLAATSIAFISVYTEVKQNKFRSALMEKAHVAPLATFFYSDFASEKQKATKENADLIESIRAAQLNATRANNINDATYSYAKFLDDLQKNNVSIENFDAKIKEKPAYKLWMYNYYLAYLVQNPTATVAINSKDYTLEAISQRVKTMELAEAKEALEVPADLILTLTSTAKDTFAKAALIEALLDAPKLATRDVEFYKNVKLTEENMRAVELIKETLLKAYPRVKFSSATQYKDIAVGSLDEEFKAEALNQKIKAEERQKDYLANRSKLEAELNKNMERSRKLVELVNLIDKMYANVAEYDQHKKLIKAKLEELNF